MTPRIIGLAGHGGVGKDTVADIMVVLGGFTKFSFSDALYEEVSQAFNVPVSALMRRDTKESPMSELTVECCASEFFQDIMLIHLRKSWDGLRTADLGRKPLSPRTVLQLWGTEYRRDEDPDYWVKKASEFAEKFFAANHAGRLVNTSVRFENEAKWIMSMGGKVYGVLRPVPRPNGHAAEEPLPLNLLSGFIDNRGTIEELNARVVKLIGASDPKEPAKGKPWHRVHSLERAKELLRQSLIPVIRDHNHPLANEIADFIHDLEGSQVSDTRN